MLMSLVMIVGKLIATCVLLGAATVVLLGLGAFDSDLFDEFELHGKDAAEVAEAFLFICIFVAVAALVVWLWLL